MGYGASPVQRFVARQNIERYQQLLDGEINPERRARIEALLAEAYADLDRAEGRKPGSVYPPARPRG